MKYWLLRPDGSAADGPYEPHELRAVPGFGPDRIIAPVNAQTVDVWKPASTFADLRVLFIKPPPVPAAPPRPAPAAQRPQGISY